MPAAAIAAPSAIIDARVILLIIALFTADYLPAYF